LPTQTEASQQQEQGEKECKKHQEHRIMNGDSRMALLHTQAQPYQDNPTYTLLKPF